MRILSIAFALATVSDASVGGAEQILATLDRELVAAGHDSMVVAAADSRVRGQLFGTAPLPPQITHDYYNFRYTEHSRKIAEALNSGPVDLVHMHGYDFWEFLPNLDVPILATLHLPPRWYANWIYYNDRPRFHLNCVSDSQRARVPDTRLVVQTIQNGVDIPALDPLPMSHRHGAVILGRICPEKGTHLGIAAALKAGMPLTIAGQAFGYPEHLHYFQNHIVPFLDQASASEQPLTLCHSERPGTICHSERPITLCHSERRSREESASPATTPVKYIGPVGGQAKINLLRSARCVLIPSTAPETSSLTAMEAFACGTPVIAFRSGALPEIVEHGKTGFIVDDLDAMSNAISCLDKINPVICRQAAMQRFSARRMARQYIDLYEHLIGLRRAVPICAGEHIVGPSNHSAA